MEDDAAVAFDLQLQEVLTASLLDGDSPDSEVFGDVSGVIPSGIQRELLEHYHSQHEWKRVRLDLNRQIHDRAFAHEISGLPDNEWHEIVDNLERPFGEGSSSSKLRRGSRFRVYVKGVVEFMVGGVGVAVCDMNDGLLFELSKGFSGKDYVGNHQWIEFKAMIEGLEIACMLDLSPSTFITTNPLVSHGATPQLTPDITPLSEHINLSLRKLSNVSVSLVSDNAMKYALELARKASAAKATHLEGTSKRKIITENCAICSEDTDVDQIFQISDCLHRYCFNCMSKHVQMKLLQGILPKCPYPNCKSELTLDSCKNFLSPELLDMMSQRIKEGSIPMEDKVYCPYRKCSSLSSKHELARDVSGLDHGDVRKGCRRCPKCSGIFCLNCKVPWHQNSSCRLFQLQDSVLDNEDNKLKSLASSSRWRQCPKCSHMVSLAEGCYHIYCRCGHEFCYTCGAEWKNKKATCTCPIWDEANIIRR